MQPVQQLAGTDHVNEGMAACLSQRLAGTGFCCEMNHHFGREFGQQRIPGAWLADIGNYQFTAVIQGVRPFALGMDLRVKVVHYNDLSEPVGQAGRQRTADEAGAAGDQTCIGVEGRCAHESVR